MLTENYLYIYIYVVIYSRKKKKTEKRWGRGEQRILVLVIDIVKRITWTLYYIYISYILGSKEEFLDYLSTILLGSYNKVLTNYLRKGLKL